MRKIIIYHFTSFEKNTTDFRQNFQCENWQLLGL